MKSLEDKVLKRAQADCLKGGGQAEWEMECTQKPAVEPFLKAACKKVCELEEVADIDNNCWIVGGWFQETYQSNRQRLKFTKADYCHSVSL